MWIQQDSCPDYMLKAEDCLRAEEERVNNYLHQSSKTKLLEQARDRSRLSEVSSLLTLSEHQHGQVRAGIGVPVVAETLTSSL